MQRGSCVPVFIALRLAFRLVVRVLLLSPPPRPCFASLTRSCCRLGSPGPCSLALYLVLLQERRPRGRLTTRPRPRPRPRRLPARRFRPHRRPGRLRMHARWPRALLCLCRHRPPRRNRVRCWRLVPSRRSTHRFGRSPCKKNDRWVRCGEKAEEGGTWGRVAESFIRARSIIFCASGVSLVQSVTARTL
jgi:hypothetical protein